MFVSRAGEKLDFALKSFNVDVNGLVCADLGCSTGGFTDVLLQNGAKKVYAVDTGYGELAWTLRNDERVVVMERTNALHVKLPEKVDFISIDVNWTRQKLIIPKAYEMLSQNDGQNVNIRIISLIKSHYEADTNELRKGKISDARALELAERVVKDFADMGFDVAGMVKSPIKGLKAGNTEFLIALK